MAQFGDKTAVEIGRYSDAELAVIDDFLTRMAAVTRDEANALRDAPDREAAEQSDYAAPIGGLSRARLLFKSGANELLIRGSTAFDDLYRATFDGPVPQVRLRDGIVTVQYKGRWQWDWRDRQRRRGAQCQRPVGRRGRSAAPTSSRASSRRVDLRSFEMTGGVDQLRLTLGQPTGIVPIRLDRRRQQRPVRAAGRRARAAAAVGRRRRRRVRSPEAGRDGGAGLLESAGAAEAADRFVIEVTGGASRIAVVEAAA